jgi:histidine triad (HIT) family protein
METDCIFCKIVAGQIPSTRVYEDADTLAFMDIGPVVKGHTLVIPKAHHNPITGVPLPLLQKVIATVQRIAAALYAGLGADGVNVTQANGPCAGQVVPHLHFHIIPRHAHDGRLHHWVPGQYADPAEMQAFAAKIRAGLAQSRP